MLSFQVFVFKMFTALMLPSWVWLSCLLWQSSFLSLTFSFLPSGRFHLWFEITQRYFPPHLRGRCLLWVAGLHPLRLPIWSASKLSSTRPLFQASALCVGVCCLTAAERSTQESLGPFRAVRGWNAAKSVTSPNAVGVKHSDIWAQKTDQYTCNGSASPAFTQAEWVRTQIGLCMLFM